jgi:hypothetical protein
VSLCVQDSVCVCVKSSQVLVVVLLHSLALHVCVKTVGGSYCCLHSCCMLFSFHYFPLISGLCQVQEEDARALPQHVALAVCQCLNTDDDGGYTTHPVCVIACMLHVQHCCCQCACLCVCLHLCWVVLNAAVVSSVVGLCIFNDTAWGGRVPSCSLLLCCCMLGNDS